MKVLGIESLAIPDVKTIKFARFKDERGYFTESFRLSDLDNQTDLGSLAQKRFVQGNESFSRQNVIRGLHFQWNPFMGKLVRTVKGHMVDIVLDIRKGSPTLGKIFMHDMPAKEDLDYGEWIWVPPGFAHGNYFKEDTVIEYLCTGEYSQGCEAGVSPLSPDLDWQLCDQKLKSDFDQLIAGPAIISEKDKTALNLTAWLSDPRSENFVYGQI